MKYVPVVALALFVVAGGCERAAVSSSTTEWAEKNRQFIDDYNAELLRQQKQGAEHLRRTEEQMAKVDLQDARYDAVLAKWEEQQQRIDDILTRWEHLLARVERMREEPAMGPSETAQDGG